MPREALPERAENLVGRGYFPLLLPMAAVFWTPGLGRVDQGHLSHFFLFVHSGEGRNQDTMCLSKAGWGPGDLGVESLGIPIFSLL